MGTPKPTKTAVELINTPCKNKGPLFESYDLYDHRDAAKLCAICPGRQMCLVAATLEKYATGTYGGALFINGHRRSA